MPVELTCAVCGDTYSRPPSKVERSRYCSAECKHADHRERVTMTCDQCSDEFEVRACYADGRRYCGRECHVAARARRVELTCENCGDTYSLPASRAEGSRYCSAGCKHADQVERVELVCEQCGDPFEVRPCYADGRRYCDRECSDAARTRRVEVACSWCGRQREVKRYRADEFSYCSDTCKMESARASQYDHGTPVEQVEAAIEDADGPLTREALAEAVQTNIERALDHAIETLGAEVASGPEMRVVHALRSDGPMSERELRDAAGVRSGVLARLKDAHVVVWLGEANGYHLVESLPPVAQPRDWSPPEWAEPAAAAKAEGD